MLKSSFYSEEKSKKSSSTCKQGFSQVTPLPLQMLPGPGYDSQFTTSELGTNQPKSKSGQVKWVAKAAWHPQGGGGHHPATYKVELDGTWWQIEDYYLRTAGILKSSRLAGSFGLKIKVPHILSTQDITCIGSSSFCSSGTCCSHHPRKNCATQHCEERE